MDKSWNIGDWEPTACARSSWLKPREQQVKQVIPKLPQRTNDIAQRPYSPQCWLDRGKLLLFLGYPELAAGDLYKAKMLCEAFETPQDIDLVEKIRECFGVKTNRLQKLTNLRPGKGKDPKESDFDEGEIPVIKIEVYDMLVMALEHCLSVGEAIYHCEQAISQFSGDKKLTARFRSLGARHNKDQLGAFTVLKYPWMDKDHAMRPAHIFAEALDHVEGISEDKCTLMESSLAEQPKKKKVRWVDQVFTRPLSVSSNKQSSSTGLEAGLQRLSLSRSVALPNSDFLGVFANSNIRRNACILKDVTVTGVASIKIKSTCENCYGPLELMRYSRVCCNVQYCSALCRDLAITGYHKETCGRIDTSNAPEVQHDGTFKSCIAAYEDTNTDFDINNQLLLRFLATAKAEGKDPLDHETIARLANQYDKRPEMPFSLINNIITPLRMLRTIGVDIFADPSFDTWVLLTIWHRIHLHKQQGPYMGKGRTLSINPVLALFNHSCDANAAWKFDGDSTTVVVYALRDIEDGEEVFVSYIGDVANKSKQERLRKLSGWLDRCRCKRCENE